MEQVNINIPFPAKLNCDPNGFAYVEDERFSASCYAPPSKAKKQLKAELQSSIDDALMLRANQRRCVLMCNDGTVFLVRYNYGWGYAIADSTRSYSSSCMMPGTYDDALKAARDHAEQGFDGIAWECTD